MITLLQGDALTTLRTLPDQSVQTCVTSPPYWGLRKYSDDPREIGNEPTPADYVAALLAVFAECWRVLRDDGTMWVNLGDAYAMNGTPGMSNLAELGKQYRGGGHKRDDVEKPARRAPAGLVAKNLLGMPWRVAFALQDAGWILRSDIIWSKPNCMPESVTDRPTRAHEYLFLFAKQARYYYDAAAIAEPATGESGNARSFRGGGVYTNNQSFHNSTPAERETHGNVPNEIGTRNKRTVWTIATQPFSGAHFATMPEAPIEPCILAGSSAQACETCGAAWGRVVERVKFGKAPSATKYDDTAQAGPLSRSRQARRSAGFEDIPAPIDLGFAPRCACPANTGSAASVVLDPFGGSGTVARVAERFQRNAILIDLNQAYIDLQEKRTDKVQIEMFK